MCVYVYACMCMCVYVYIYIYIHRRRRRRVRAGVCWADDGGLRPAAPVFLGARYRADLPRISATRRPTAQIFIGIASDVHFVCVSVLRPSSGAIHAQRRPHCSSVAPASIESRDVHFITNFYYYYSSPEPDLKKRERDPSDRAGEAEGRPTGPRLL